MTASRNLNVRITQQCCIGCFERLRDIQDLGNYLSAFVAGGPLLSMLSSHPIAAAFAIATTDWDSWRRALEGIPVIVRERCRTAIAIELNNHASTSDEGLFWLEMYQLFSD
jgi:hypothetical protein